MGNKQISYIERGFALIELMIMVAIIGVLATLALPEYKNYTIHTKISEGLLLAAPCQRAMEEIAATGARASTTCVGYRRTILSRRLWLPASQL